MIKLKIIGFMILLSYSCYCQKGIIQPKAKLETVNEFRDGYAWVKTRNEINPNADQDYEIFIDNYYYTMFTINSEGKILLKKPSINYRFYFPMRRIWNDLKIIPISFDSLSKDISMEFKVIKKDTFEFETPFIIVNTIKKYVKYNEGDDLLIFYYNKRNTFERVSGINPSPTNGVEYQRVLSPPDFVQEFIKKIKKEKLRKVERKTFINNSFFKDTIMYLLKNDEVEILEEKSGWLKIRYYGKKTIEGWIKKSDVTNL